MEQLNLKLKLNDNGSITATWSPITGATRYHAYMYKSESGSEKYIVYNEKNLHTTSYTSKAGLEANRSYKVVLVAYTSKGTVSDGGSVLILSDFYINKTLAVPQNIKAIPAVTSVTISFDRVTGASSYEIYFNGTVHTVTASTATISKTINGLKQQTSYTYAVRAKNVNRTGAYSSTMKITTLAASQPGKPTPSLPAPGGITKSSTANSATIVWKPVSGADSYNVKFNGNTYRVNSNYKTFTGLSAGTAYSFQICANNAKGSGAYGTSMTVTTAPGVPQGITAANTADSVTLSWNAQKGADGYVVHFDNTEITVTGTTSIHRGLAPNTSHTYQIRAKNADGMGVYSNLKTIKTAAKTLQAPSGVKKSSSENSATISWGAVSGATGYAVKFNGTAYYTTATSKTFTGLSPNTGYNYQVCAQNSGGYGAYGPVQTVRTTPAAPGFTASVDEGSITMSWGAVTGAESYDVSVDGKESNVKGTSKKVTGLNPNTSHSCKMRARNADGASSYSPEKKIKTALPRPTSVKATSTSNSATVSWNPVSGTTGYDVQFNGAVQRVGGTSWTYSGLKSGTGYSYTVRTYGTSGYSSYGTPATVYTVPDVPGGLTVTPSWDSAVVSWNPVSGATGYEVQVGSVTQSTTGTSATVKGLKPGTDYSCRVRAKNSGGAGAFSTTRYMRTPLAPPATPANVRATATYDSVTVSWNSSAGAQNYDVLLGGRLYSTTGTSRTITGLKAETNYSYQVRANNASGSSAYSPAAAIRTPAGPPAVPTNIRATAKTDSVTISWNPVPGATGYDIMLGGTLYSAAGTSRAITGLTPNTNYNYRVRAKNANGNSAYSDAATVRTLLAPPDTPQNVSASSTLTCVTIRWDPVRDAESYDVLWGERVYNVTGTSWTISGQTANATYLYQVRARNAAGVSSYCPPKIISTKKRKRNGLPHTGWKQTYPGGRIPYLGLDPVNPLTGAFLWSNTLLEDHGKDALHFTVMYDSEREGFSHVMGKGWTHCGDYLLYMDADFAYFENPYNKVIPFHRSGEEFLPEQGFTMEKNEDGTHSVKSADNTEYVFGSNCGLLKIMDGGKETLRFTTDADGRITKMEGRYGAALTFSYEGEYLAEVTDRMGNSVSIAYAGDNLASITNPLGNTMTFTCDDDHRILKITDFAGSDYLTNRYDAAGRVVEQKLAGRGSAFVSYDTQQKVTTFTDELGNRTEYHYDTHLRVTRVACGDSEILNSYNEDGQLVQRTDALGNVTKLTYDGLGRMESVEHPDGTTQKASYGQGNLPVKVTEKDGTETLYGYDERNNLISVTDARGNVCSYSYDESDNLISYTDREGNVWTYSYDADGHLEQTADPQGNVSLYSHDKAGRLISHTTSGGKTVRYHYSAVGNLLGIVDSDGSLLFEYDANGSRTGITDRRGNGQRIAYNEMGQVSLVTDRMGREYRFSYDEKGELIQETDPLGYKVSYGYDAMGNRISRTDQNGGTTQYRFDAASQLTEVRDAEGGTIKYVYDSMGRVKTVTDPLERQTAYEYDSAGRITKKTDPLGQSVSYTYDPAGNLLTRTDEDGVITTYSYDKENRLLSMETPAGTTSFTYDKLGRLLSVLDPDGYSSGSVYDVDGNLAGETDRGGGQTAYSYDDAGRISEKTAPDGGKTLYAYDANGNCTQITDAEGNQYAYAYDAEDRLTKITDPLGYETSYEYDDRGQIISVMDANGGETSFAYDGNGNLILETNPLGGERAYVYDSLNRLTKLTDEEGDVCSFAYDAAGNRISYVDANENQWTYTYDELNRLTGVRDQKEGEMAYAYTNTGKLAQVTDPEGAATTYQYDSAGRLVQMSDALGHSLVFTYDSMGRLLAETDAEGNTTRYEYSPAGKLLSVTRPEGDVTSYTYDAAGRRLTETDPLGNVTSYEYDKLGRVTAITDAMGERTFFTYTAKGEIATVTDAQGGVTWYTYDGCGNLTRTVSPSGAVTVYEYDAMNNQIRECLSDSGEETHATLYQYDKKGQVIKEINPVLDEKAYAYDGNGNLSLILDEDGNETSVRYDLNNRPVHIGYGDGKEASFRYDKRGALVEITDWNGITALERDTLGRLAKVTDPAGRSVGYGYDPRGNVASVTYPDGSAVSYGYDGDNRLSLVTDAEGNETKYSYDPAGRLSGLTQTGGSVSCSYNAKGLPTKAEYRAGDILLLEESLTYDVLGRITGSRRVGNAPAVTGSESYAYDAAGRLLAYGRDGAVETYSYDLMGNRLSRQKDGGETVSYEYNALNQLTAMESGGVRYGYEYDRRGNLTRELKGQTPIRSYTYDAAGYMTLGSNGETGETSAYGYNALGMCVKRSRSLPASGGQSPDGLTAGSGNAWNISYVPDFLGAAGSDLMAYREGTASMRAVYGRGYELISQRADLDSEMRTAHFLPDLYGSSLFALDGQGQTRFAERDIWGRIAGRETGAEETFPLAGEARFTSYPYDPVTGVYFAHARLYDADLGRMLSKDPVKRGLNGYPYCGNDPVNHTDPTGEIPTVLVFGAGGGILGGIAGFAGSALDQLSSGDGFSLRRALGSAANGMVTGAVKGALIGSGAGIPVAFGADFAAGAAGNLLEQAISGERVNAGRGILGGLSNAVSGAIFGNVPFKNAGQAFGKGALAGAATSGLGYLSDLISRQPKSGQMGHFPGGAVTRTPYERLMDPRGTCILQDIFGGGLGVRKAYGYRYEMRDPDQPVRDGFDLGDFLRSTLIGGLMGGLSGVAFYGMDKAVGALKGSLNRGRKSCSEIYYRTMCQADYDYLRMTGELPSTGETFISPTKLFSSDYNGVMVEFELRNGTTAMLEEIGLSNGDRAILARKIYPQMSYVTGTKWSENFAFFKAEGAQINIGLGKGAALEIFNSNIITFNELTRGFRS